ncbi:MAG: hypothetical protein LC808_12380 [Actinobacteria bacterium]|nr:hypothetical protein [Actinomycetota bacterium]
MRRAVVVSVVLACIATFSTGAAVQAHPVATEGLFSPDSHPYGKSYAQWAANWFEWLVEIPAAEHPSLNPDNCDKDQSGKVWFLAPSFGGHLKVDCTVPAGKAIFVSPGGGFCTEALSGFRTYRDLLRCAREDFRTVSNIEISIDGRPVRHRHAYKGITRPFTVELPEGNFFGVPAQTSRTVLIGFFYILRPFKPGTTHVIKVSDVLSPEGTEPFEASATYHVTITPRDDD